MKILAVDSSTAKASAAICEDRRVLGEMNIEDGKTHSEKLVPMIQKVLSDTGININDVDYFAASTGPGSFTGLRIGVVTIKAIAMAVEKQCVSVPTLDALAYNCHDFNGIICPMIDARNNQVFTAIYRGLGREVPKKLTGYMAEPVDELLIRMSTACSEYGLNNIVLVGDAAVKYETFFKNSLLENNICVKAASAGKIGANAVSVAQLAFDLVDEGKIVACDELVPDYLRKSSAEQAKDRNKGL